MYKVLVEEKASKNLEKIPNKLKNSITKKLKLLEQGIQPTLDIKKLKGYKNHYRLRVGNYRILFYLENANIIVYKIGKRESVYE